MKIKDILGEDTDMKIAAVNGNDVTIDQNGSKIQTTTDALVPDPKTPGAFTMKPPDPNTIKPGAAVSSDSMEDTDDEEEHHDLIGDPKSGSVSDDGTDKFINDVRDAAAEQAQGYGPEANGRSERHMGIMSPISESDKVLLDKMLSIAGLR